MKEPKIRFKGFQGEWETSIIGDIATFSKGRGYSKSDLRSEGNPIVLYGRLYTNYSSVIESVDTFASLQNGSVLTKGNEVIIPGSGETPEDIAVASAVEQKGVILGGDLNVLTFDQEKISPAFAAMSITYSNTHNELSGYAQGKTVVHLHNSSISKGHISYPYIDEQQSISTYFQHLDALIQSTTKKIESLKQVKAASLQSMFPQEGETTPRVRFKGFEGEWEEMPFSETFDYLKNNSLSRAELSDGGVVMNIHYGDVLIKYGECVDVGKEVKTFVKEEYIAKRLHQSCAITNGDIIFADAAEDNTVGKCSEIIANEDDAIISGLHTIPCRPMKQFATRYLGYYLNSNAYHNQLLPHIQGIKISSISKKAISQTHINSPLDIAEQSAIASYFTSLDRQISLQSQRLEKLKQIKAACLDNMFV